MIIRQIRPLDGNIKINGDNHAKILVVYPPSLLADLGIKLIDHDLLVADLIDDVVARANSENMRLEFLTSYQKVLPKCDWITATGQSLKSYEDIAGQNIESLPNGVEVDAYKNDQAPRRGIKDAPQIGYVGSINKAMDFELLQFCLQKLPDLQFIFAGFFDQSGKQNLKKCRRYPNFKYIGELHFAKVPEFLLSCDVLISIKEAGALVKGNDSMKLYQYLATGKPVVTTSMPPADRFRDLVWIADDGQSFVSCLREAVKNVDDEYDSAKRISAARKHSWTSKIEYFEQRIEKKLIEQAAIKNDH
jgi:glycosyltransferase involved in cell wall biosynthesis